VAPPGRSLFCRPLKAQRTCRSGAKGSAHHVDRGGPIIGAIGDILGLAQEGDDDLSGQIEVPGVGGFKFLESSSPCSSRLVLTQGPINLAMANS